MYEQNFSELKHNMILPVYVYGMAILRRHALEIPEGLEGLDQLIKDMFETMKFSNGIGLAAPQIGKSLRLFIVDATPVGEDKDEPELLNFKRVFINPYIVEEFGDKWKTEEGCLSIPNIREEVSRFSKVRIEYFDERFNLKEEEFDGFRARIIQHEYDHLDGKLFVDRISQLRKKLLTARLNSISKGNADCDYKMIFPKR